MRKSIKKFLESIKLKDPIEQPPADYLYLAASSGKVMIGGTPVTPDLAIKIAAELPAMAAIAKMLEVQV